VLVRKITWGFWLLLASVTLSATDRGTLCRRQLEDREKLIERSAYWRCLNHCRRAMMMHASHAHAARRSG
jgi:hypothetical protein